MPAMGTIYPKSREFRVKVQLIIVGLDMIIDCHTHLQCPERGEIRNEHAEICEKLDGCFVMAGLLG